VSDGTDRKSDLSSDAGRPIVVCRADELGESQTAKFRLGAGKNAPEGFVVRHRGELHAWRNECRHIPMTMDWVENRFLSRDKCWIQCATHGALYDIATGQCVAGPPTGKALRPLEVSVEEGNVVVRLPAGSPAE
jgi:nitrite reductase/ring-hydroxylating ferredoxin subunit